MSLPHGQERRLCCSAIGHPVSPHPRCDLGIDLLKTILHCRYISHHQVAIQLKGYQQFGSRGFGQEMEVGLSLFLSCFTVLFKRSQQSSPWLGSTPPCANRVSFTTSTVGFLASSSAMGCPGAYILVRAWMRKWGLQRSSPCSPAALAASSMPPNVAYPPGRQAQSYQLHRSRILEEGRLFSNMA